MNTRRAVRSQALLGVFLAVTFGVLLSACSGKVARSPQPFFSTEVQDIDYGRGLRIADTAGHLRRLEDFRGQVTVVFFGFTSCPDVCPATLLRLKRARTSLGADADTVQVILITVDPERDTAARLRSYVANFDPSFIGLRPEPNAVAAVTQAFHAIAVKVPAATAGDYTMDHSATIYVYDRANRLRLITQPDFKLDDFAADLRRLSQE